MGSAGAASLVFRWIKADMALLADFLVNMAASADVLAMAKVEIDISTIPEAKNVSGKHSLALLIH